MAKSIATSTPADEAEESDDERQRTKDLVRRALTDDVQSDISTEEALGSKAVQRRRSKRLRHS